MAAAAATSSNIKKGRKSFFKEIGLETVDDNDNDGVTTTSSTGAEHKTQGAERAAEQAQRGSTAAAAAAHPRKGHHRHEKQDEVKKNSSKRDDDALEEESTSKETTSPQPSNNNTNNNNSSSSKPWYAKLATSGSRRMSRGQTGSGASTSTVQKVSTMTMVVVLVALMSPLLGSRKDSAAIAEAGPVGKRADSPTDVCARWAQQVAIVNGTLYLYGGEAKTSIDQVNDTWNNDLLTLDLTSSWKIGSPSLTGLPQPSGPPAVALGSLWNDYNSLYLYGGEFADNPYVEPAAVSVWQYDIASSAWTEYSNLETTAGNNSDGGGVALQRAAEGAGISVPELGLSWYFGGHLDLSTTPGWSDQTPRVYLKSLLEFTHPGYLNPAIPALTTTGAPSAGAYRNITQGGLQTATTFTERADGVLVFIPGWGVSGVLLGLAGGTATSFTDDMRVLDVYDIATSTWYHQTTSGTPPGVRVNPCAVVAAAPDASSFQVYLYGGQNLQPAGAQVQYDDLYILSIPAFTWLGPISVTTSGDDDGVPTARAGHTCTLRDGQMVVVGGFNTTTTTCDSPGVYVLNASSLAWTGAFTALGEAGDADAGNSVLAGSRGYTVPEVVVSVIGGNPSGSATVTAPVSSATGGPFATGKSPVFTVTASGGGRPTATITTSSGGTAGSRSGGGMSAGLIAAIVVACLACMAAGYLGYCAWLYRRQVVAYKTHLAVQNRFPARSASRGSFGRMFAFGRSRRGGGGYNMNKDKLATAAAAGAGGWNEKRDETTTSSSSNGGESFAWVGRNLPPPSVARSSGGGAGNSMPSEERRPSRSSDTSSTEMLLDGQEPSFFSVVMGPRRALRVVNGLEDGPGET